jgi:hypothetical protein
MEPANTLAKFLAQHKVQKGQPFTHTSMGEPFGAFYIPPDDLPLFYELYTRHFIAKDPLYLTEKHLVTNDNKTVGPILIDFDFRQKVAHRVYKYQTIEDCVRRLEKIIRPLVNMEFIKCYVLEKPAPKPDKTQGVWKDGVHLIFPDVVTCPELQYVIRRQFIEEHSELLTFEGIINPIQQIYDEAVIESNNWFMYGSKKPEDKNPWTATALYTFKGWGLPSLLRNVMDHAMRVSGSLACFDDNDPALIKTLSIRNTYETCSYSDLGNEMINAYIQQKSQQKRSRQCIVASVTDSAMASSQAPPSIQPPSTVGTFANVDFDLALQLVDLLSVNRAADEQLWIRVGWCLHNLENSDRSFEKWVEFSKKYPDKFDQGVCEDKWKRMEERNKQGGLGMGSLIMWAKQDDLVKTLELIAKRQHTNPEDTTVDMIRLSNMTHPYDFVKQVFEKTHFKVINPFCFVEENDDKLNIKDEQKTRKAYINIYCKIKQESESGEIKEKKVPFMDMWLKDPKIRTYDYFDFLPPPLLCPPNVFNMWSGFAIDQIESELESRGSPSMFLKHASILVNHDPVCLKYFINWLAQIVQQPGKLIGIALVFISNEGAGKNIFLDHFAQIIGKQFYFETADPEKDLFGRFCNGRKNKLLIDIDESRRKDTFANADIIKNMITSEHLNYEQKGIDPIEICNFNRFVFTTNHMHPIKITDNSRRFVLFECSNEKIGNTAYFKAFATYMQDPINQKAIMAHLRSIDLSDFNWNDRPITETYLANKQACADPVLMYIEYLYFTVKKERKSLHIDSGMTLLRGLHWFLEHRLKAKQEHINVHNQVTFGCTLKKLCDTSNGAITKTINWGPKRQSAYKFDMDKLEVFLKTKGLLSELSYMFADDD